MKKTDAENRQEDLDLTEKHTSRKKKKGGAAKKILVIALIAVVVLGGAGALIVNHYLNKIPKIDLSTETTLSPSEFWELIGREGEDDPTDEAANSLESDVETEPAATGDESSLPETADTEMKATGVRMAPITNTLPGIAAIAGRRMEIHLKASVLMIWLGS